jgi:hypothetical protein
MIPSSEQLKGDFVWTYKQACELCSWETVVERNSRSCPGDFFFCAFTSLAAATNGCTSFGGRDDPLKLAGVRGLADQKCGGFQHRLAAMRSQMVSGIGVNDHPNGESGGSWRWRVTKQ